MRGRAAILLLASCAAEPLARTEQPIVNGQVDTGDPAVVSVGGFCTGTLVSPRTVLTAHHCIGSGSNPGFEVYFGTYDGDSAGTYIDAVHQARYPNGGPGQGDLAMVTIAAPGPATPIPVSGVDLATMIDQPIRIVGFGVTAESGGGGGTKRKATATLVRVDEVDMFASNDPSGTCYGDSGGPNFMMIDGVEHVIGATSYGTEACGSGEDASARTDYGYAWIQEYINAHDPASCDGDGRCATGCPTPDPDCEPPPPPPAPDAGVEDPASDAGVDDPMNTGDGGTPADPTDGTIVGGCAAGGTSSLGALALVLVCLGARRRRAR